MTEIISRPEKIRIAEDQIEEKRQEIDYDTREFTIEIIVNKYISRNDDDTGEIYVPEYQRELVWDITHQSRLIESVILGLPIPLIFVAEIQETGKLEIVDGSQIISTLVDFLTNKLQLQNLKTLDSLNGFYFNDLSPSRQRRFKNTPLRMVILEKSDEKIRHEIYNRLNTISFNSTL
jgi:hypothetical protein